MAVSFPSAARKGRRLLGRPPRWEMRDIVGESNPAVLRLLPYRSRRPWEVGVMKSADGNPNMVWPQVGLPKHRRPASRAEMHPNLSSFLPVADIDGGWSLGANMFLLEKGDNAEHRTGSPLTLATVADAYNSRIGGYFDTQGTTRAMRSFRHSAPFLSKGSETTGGRLSERPLILDRAAGSEISQRRISPHGGHDRMVPGGSRKRCMKTRSSQRPNLCPTSVKWATRSNSRRS
jgi:hypothetical protein